MKKWKLGVATVAAIAALGLAGKGAATVRT